MCMLKIEIVETNSLSKRLFVTLVQEVKWNNVENLWFHEENIRESFCIQIC